MWRLCTTGTYRQGILTEEPEDYTFYLKEALRKGLSFPRARQQALSSYLKDENVDQVLDEPNNILSASNISKHYIRPEA